MGAKRSFYWEGLPPEKLWYLIGWITSDGSLSKDGRHIDLTSKDIELLEAIKKEMFISSKIGRKSNKFGGVAYNIQIGSVSFYNYLQSIGLCPNKSLRLGKIAVADDMFPDFLRGMIDGDGSIRSWIHPTNGREQWSLCIYSGSKDFLQWVREMALRSFGVKGGLHSNTNKNICYVLKYGKLAAQEILVRCYKSEKISLDRKDVLARSCVATKRGWSKSKTIEKV